MATNRKSKDFIPQILLTEHQCLQWDPVHKHRSNTWTVRSFLISEWLTPWITIQRLNNRLLSLVLGRKFKTICTTPWSKGNNSKKGHLVPVHKYAEKAFSNKNVALESHQLISKITLCKISGTLASINQLRQLIWQWASPTMMSKFYVLRAAPSKWL